MTRLFRIAVTACIAAIALLLACSPDARAQICEEFGTPTVPIAVQDTWTNCPANWIADAPDPADTNNNVYHRINNTTDLPSTYKLGSTWANYTFSCDFWLLPQCGIYGDYFDSDTSGHWSGTDPWVIDTTAGVYHPASSTTATSASTYCMTPAPSTFEVSCTFKLVKLPETGTVDVSLYTRSANGNHVQLKCTIDSFGALTARIVQQGAGVGVADQLLTGTDTISAGTEYSMHVEFTGSGRTLTANVDALKTDPGASISAALNVSGKVGLGVDADASFGLDNVLFDNFCINNVPATQPQPTFTFYSRYVDDANCLKVTLQNSGRDCTAMAYVNDSGVTPASRPVLLGTFSALQSGTKYHISLEAGTDFTVSLTGPGAPTFSPVTLSRLTTGTFGFDFKGDTLGDGSGVFDHVCYTSGTAAPVWTGCVVDPNPVGRLDAGQLRVYITCSGGGTGLNAYIIPQGVSAADRSRQMLLTPLTATDPTYVFTNPVNITTVLNSNNPPSPARDDVILDGHAVVDVAIGTISVPPSTTDPTANAARGRHLLIDTIPPRVEITRRGVSLNADAYVTMHNEVPPLSKRMHFAALGLEEGIRHPYSPWSGVALQRDTDILDSVARPSGSPLVLEGGSSPATTATVVYNIGSYSNYATIPNRFFDLPGESTLDFEVDITVTDRDVFTMYPYLSSISNVDRDPYTNSSVRQTSGLASIDPSVPVALSIAVGTDPPMAKSALSTLDVPIPGSWQIGSSAAENVTITVAPAVGGANEGYFNAATAPIPDMDVSAVKSVTVAWRFVSSTGVTGIPLMGQSMNLSGLLVGQDHAKNKSTDDSSLVQPRLDVHWLRGDDVITLGFQETPSYTGFSTINWGLSNTPLSFPSGPTPLYSCSVWKCEEPRKENRDLNYKPLLGWRAWTTDSTVGAANFDQTTLDGLKDYYVLVVAAAMDAAGNVTPWDETLRANSDGSLTVDSTGDSGDTWHRFLVPGQSSLVDTSLDVNFEYTNPTTNLGPATIIQYPPTADRMIVGTFDIGLVTGLQTDLQNAFVVVELEQNGAVVYRGALVAGGADTVSLTVPGSFPANDQALSMLHLTSVSPPNGFRLGRPDSVVDYVFRAYTVVLRDDGSGNWILPPIVDTSPVNFNFKVVPKSIENYLESSGGEQPIKVYERE